MRALLDLLRKPLLPQPTPSLTLHLADRPLSIALKRSKRAKRMTLRMTREGDSAVMTLPLRVSRAEAQSFAERSSTWLENQLRKQPDKVEVADGASLTLRGETYTLAFTGRARGTVICDEASKTISIPGIAPHQKRRLVDWLKQQAQLDLQTASRGYAEKMGARFSSIHVRDQKSRWGSCTSDGKLSYSWRLIMAPPHVLDYVAAHEVAHLLQMNHSPRFWRLVLTHCKHTKSAKDWLKKNGQTLHRLT
jgi:predicted metal-dependent hydrolase